MNLQTITVFGIELPLYGLFLYLGAALAFGVAVFLAKKDGLPFWELLGATVFAMIGAFVGAKLLFLLVSSRQIIEENIPPLAYLRGGFVFYGGLFGGFAGYAIYARMFRMPLFPFTDIAATVAPLGHAVGRVGCFFGGCCYGMVYDGPLHVVYHSAIDVNTPLEEPLFPLQLLSSAGLLTLFVVLLLLRFLLPEKKGRTTAIYLTCYAVMRFAVEFARGDRERGVLAGLSTSQWCSILLLIAVITVFVVKKKKEKQTKSETLS